MGKSTIFGLNSLFGPFWCSDWLRHIQFFAFWSFFTHSSVRSFWTPKSTHAYNLRLLVSPTKHIGIPCMFHQQGRGNHGMSLWSMGDSFEEPIAYLFGYFRSISGICFPQFSQKCLVITNVAPSVGSRRSPVDLVQLSKPGEFPIFSGGDWNWGTACAVGTLDLKWRWNIFPTAILKEYMGIIGNNCQALHIPN